MEKSDLKLKVGVAPREEVYVEAGVTDMSYWVKLVKDAAIQAKYSDCGICAQARPAFLTVPSLLSNAFTFFCMFELHMKENPSGACQYLKKCFPLSSKTNVPPAFKPVKSRHVFGQEGAAEERGGWTTEYDLVW